MKQKKQTCSTCGAYKKLYRFYGLRAWHSGECYCAEHRRPAEGTGSCARWRARRAEYDLSPSRLERAEEDVRTIAEHPERLFARTFRA